MENMKKKLNIQNINENYDNTAANLHDLFHQQTWTYKSDVDYRQCAPTLLIM